MKRKKSEAKPRRIFALRPGFFVWFCVFIFCVIFTQSLRSPLSAVALTAAMLLPVISLLHLAVAAASLKLMIHTDEIECVKGTPVNFDIHLTNEGPLPLPHLELDLVLPDEKALRNLQERVPFSIAPFSGLKLSREVAFPFRGSYSVGVEAAWIYDLFKMFRVKLPLEGGADIFVMPRRLVFRSSAELSAADTDTELTRANRGNDRYEIGGIREYKSGDSMKHIHWKLSSKTQDLLVREYDVNADRRAVILCDTTAHYDVGMAYAEDGTEGETSPFAVDTNEFVADGVCETALALCRRELASGNRCILVWRDARAEGGVIVRYIDAVAELDRILREFAAFPLMAKCEGCLTYPLADLKELSGATLSIVSGNLDGDIREQLERLYGLVMEGSGRGLLEFYLINPAGRIEDREKRAAFTADLKRARDAAAEVARVTEVRR